MTIDPLTLGKVFAIAQSFASVGGDAPDPSKIALFETYNAVQVLNQRIDGLGEMLVDVRQAQIDLPAFLDRSNRQSEARVAERDALSFMEAILDRYLTLLDNISDGRDIDEEQKKFQEDLRNKSIDFDRELSVLVRASTYELPTALAAIDFQQAVNAAAGHTKSAIRKRALEKLDSVLRNMQSSMEVEVKKNNRNISALQADISDLVGGDWWLAGGDEVDMTKSHYNWALHGLNIHCWIVEVFGDINSDYSKLYSIPGDSAIWYSIHYHNSNRDDFINSCGEKLARSKNPNVYYFEDTDKFPSPRRGVTQFPSVISGPGDTAKIQMSANLSHEELRSLIDRLNVVLSIKNTIISYRKAMEDGISRLREKIYKYEGYTTRDYFTELSEIGIPAPSNLASSVLAQEITGAALEKNDLARNWAQAALAAHREIEEGALRVQSALDTLQEQQNGIRADVADMLSFAYKAMTIATVVQQLNSATASVVEDRQQDKKGEATDLNVGEHGANKVGATVSETQRSGTSSELPNTVTSAAKVPQIHSINSPNHTQEISSKTDGNYEAIDEILAKLDNMSWPTGDSTTTPPTEYEQLVAQASSLLVPPPPVGTNEGTSHPVQKAAGYAAFNSLSKYALAAPWWQITRVITEVTKPTTTEEFNTMWDSTKQANLDYRHRYDRLAKHYINVIDWRLPQQGRSVYSNELLKTMGEAKTPLMSPLSPMEYQQRYRQDRW